MLEFSSSLKISQKVLSHVLKDERLKDVEGAIKCYQNNREQGYSITTGFPVRKCISFSQHKSSDDIVVYIGAPSTESISEEAYCNSRVFKTEEMDEVIEYIVVCVLKLQ